MPAVRCRTDEQVRDERKNSRLRTVHSCVNVPFRSLHLRCVLVLMQRSVPTRRRVSVLRDAQADSRSAAPIGRVCNPPSTAGTTVETPHPTQGWGVSRLPGKTAGRWFVRDDEGVLKRSRRTSHGCSSPHLSHPRGGGSLVVE